MLANARELVANLFANPRELIANWLAYYPRILANPRESAANSRESAVNLCMGMVIGVMVLPVFTTLS